MKRILPVLACLLVALCASAYAADGNLLANGMLTKEAGAKAPAKWNLTSDVQTITQDDKDHPEGVASSLKVEIKTPNDIQGSLAQTVRGFTKGAKLTLKGSLKGSATRLAYIQVKLKKAGKEVRREKGGYNTAIWDEQKVEFATDDADEISVECKFSQSDKAKDQTVWFANLSLTENK